MFSKIFTHFQSFLDRETCRYMRYKEEEAIKETIDIINKQRQQIKEEEGSDDWTLQQITLLHLLDFLFYCLIFKNK